jgi:hypothetical protein
MQNRVVFAFAIQYALIILMIGFTGYVMLWTGNTTKSLVYVGSLILFFIVIFAVSSRQSLPEPVGIIVIHGGAAAYCGIDNKIYLPSFGFKVKTFTPGSRPLKLEGFQFPTRSGTKLSVTLMLSWKPDPESIGEYLHLGDEKMEEQVKHMVTLDLSDWSKNLLPNEVYASKAFKAQKPDVRRQRIARWIREAEASAEDRLAIPEVLVKGAVIERMSLSEINAEGGMSRHLRDNSGLITSMIAEVRSEAELDKARLQLERDFPEKKERINKLLEEKQREIRKRGLKN